MEHPVFLGILFQQPTDEILTKFTFCGNLDQSQMGLCAQENNPNIFF